MSARVCLLLLLKGAFCDAAEVLFETLYYCARMSALAPSLSGLAPGEESCRLWKRWREDFGFCCLLLMESAFCLLSFGLRKVWVVCACVYRACARKRERLCVGACV